jgi:lactam utilization protein B
VQGKHAAEAGAATLEDQAHALRSELAAAKLRATQAEDKMAAAQRANMAKDEQLQEMHGKNEALQVSSILLAGSPAVLLRCANSQCTYRPRFRNCWSA